MEQEDSEENDGEERGYEEKLQYLLCGKYPEGATKHSWECRFSPIISTTG